MQDRVLAHDQSDEDVQEAHLDRDIGELELDHEQGEGDSEHRSPAVAEPSEDEVVAAGIMHHDGRHGTEQDRGRERRDDPPTVAGGELVQHDERTENPNG